MRTRVLLKVAAVAGVLVAAAAAVHLVRARPAAAPTMRAVAAGLGPVGRQITWGLKLDTRLRQADGGGPKGALDGTTTLTGDWRVTVSGVSDTGYDLACELRSAHIVGEGFGDQTPADVERLERALSQRFWISHQSDGAAKWLHFPREMRDDVRNLLALIITESQLVRSSRHSPQWTATERDAAGTYFAAYSEARTGEIAKRKLRYLSVDGTAGSSTGAVNIQIEDSQTRFVLDDRDIVSQVSTHSLMRVDTNLGAPGLTVDVRLDLHDIRTGEEPALVGSLDRARSGLDTGPIVTQNVDPDVLQARQDARLIRNVTLAQLLATATTANIDATTRATLEALFRQRPAEIAGAMTFAHKSDRAAAKLVLEALGAAGTPAAQETLCGLAADINASAETRVDAIAALVQPKRPTPSTISQLIRLLDASEPTVSKQALYVLGAAGSRSQEVDATIAPRIEAELLRRQQHCQGDACADLLVAMGNLATPALVPAIERSLHDPNAGIRASAARALRKVQDPSADRMIADAMRDDRDPSVRSAAVLAATFRPIGPLLEPLTHLVEADPVEYVRTNAIEAVASHVGESPLVQHALLAAANSDRSPGVRRLARKILGSRLAAQNVQSGQP